MLVPPLPLFNAMISSSPPLFPFCFVKFSYSDREVCGSLDDSSQLSILSQILFFFFFFPSLLSKLYIFGLGDTPTFVLSPTKCHCFYPCVPVLSFCLPLETPYSLQSQRLHSSLLSCVVTLELEGSSCGLWVHHGGESLWIGTSSLVLAKRGWIHGSAPSI